MSSLDSVDSFRSYLTKHEFVNYGYHKSHRGGLFWVSSLISDLSITSHERGVRFPPQPSHMALKHQDGGAETDFMTGFHEAVGDA